MGTFGALIFLSLQCSYQMSFPFHHAFLSFQILSTQVEATTLNERWYGLKSQDKFLQDNISSNDVLIVSIGGNDVAMAPTPCTILSLAGLLCLPVKCIEHGVTCCTVPVNDYCFGCGPSLCSCAGACPPCLGYFRHLFGTRYVLPC